MAISSKKMRKMKHVHLDLRESVDELTCEDIIKIIHIAEHAEGKVFFIVDSKRVCLDVLEMHAGEVERALHVKGFHSHVPRKMVTRQGRFLLQSSAAARSAFLKST